MEIIHQFLQKHQPQPLRQWKIPSRSQKGVRYTVSLFQDGRYECDCQSFKECRHIKTVKELQPKKKVKLEYVYYPDRCQYCGRTNIGLSEHHLFRGSGIRPTSPTIWLCYECHNKASFDPVFAKHLQELYAQQYFEQ